MNGQILMLDTGVKYVLKSDTDITNLINTGELPQSLMEGILVEANNYIELFDSNPSKYLKRSVSYIIS